MTWRFERILVEEAGLMTIIETAGNSIPTSSTGTGGELA